MTQNYVKRILSSGVHREWENVGNRVALNTQICNNGTLTDMSIFVDEENRGQGYARFMIQQLLRECRREGFGPAFVYIDVDCSEGFWDHVGFEPNPFAEHPKDGMEFGYEKRIAWKRLLQFARE
jgi:GNAT superfamily N-acetyltransferase